MQTDYIEFKQKRQLGEIFTDTFKFIRKNYKDLFKVLFKIMIIPTILFIAATIFYNQQAFNTDLFDFTTPNFFALYTSELIISALILYAFSFLFLIFLYAGVTYIVKSYIDNQGVIIEQEVLDNVKRNLFRILGAGTLKYIVLSIGTIFCLLPGLFVSGPLFLMFPFLVFANKSASQALSESFNSVSNYWWICFSNLALGFILWYAVNTALSLPIILYTFIKGFTMVQEGSASDPSAFFDYPFIILTTILNILQYLLYFFVPIIGCFVYHNINEHSYQTGTLERIDSIGTRNE